MISHEQARKEAEQIVNQMTLAEKIAQINFRAPAIDRLGITDYNYWNEGLHGVARAGVATVFPQAIGLAALFDDALLKKVADVISTEGRAKYNQYHAEGDHDIYKGLTYWSPNINIFRDPRWGRGQETYGEDPYLTAKLGVAFIKGLQGDGPYLKLAACAKHFAVHSGPEADRHSFNAEVNQKDLYETYLPAFEAAVKEADVESFMGAYNAVNGVPACVHPELMQSILRNEWNFKGHVVSDYAALEDVHLHHHYTDTAAETMALAMKVGCNLCAGNISDALHEAIEQGLVTEVDITASVVELYTTRVRLGMFAEDNPFNSIPFEVNDCEEHRQLSLETARKSMVLLKNDDFLPLNKTELSAVSVIGPNAASVEALRGNYFGTASRYYTFLEGIQNEMNGHGRVYYALGCHLFQEHAESSLSSKHERESEAIIAAKHSDVVVLCLGLDPTIEGEQGDSGNVYGSGDKEKLHLPTVQEQLLKKVLELNKPVVVVLAAGSALSLNGFEDHPHIKAIIQAWYPGSQGGTALADIMFGLRSPSGKLPITFYKNTDNLPDFNDYVMKNRTYRYLEEEPLYPFGYGLTYGNVRLSDLDCKQNCESLSVSITIENDDKYAIDEVIQVYGRTNAEDEVRNNKLISFKRVELPKSAKKRINLTIPVANLAVTDSDGNRKLAGTAAEIFVNVASPGKLTESLTGIKTLATKIRLNPNGG
ncbi:beta-glucosidase [Amphibacillus marinus]|uniref:Beta-glucosidase n=1 Tax=Amphibacillus marinus TaxID=872970 RepID=A0A1H8GPY4_9BACI|nr:glycoside hydrolase family 3 C-terminal domain-containing protein [Amphibacillus marinus]SEN45557.1 beta-glucosidase [Amphibacillus marinus]